MNSRNQRIGCATFFTALGWLAMTFSASAQQVEPAAIQSLSPSTAISARQSLASPGDVQVPDGWFEPGRRSGGAWRTATVAQPGDASYLIAFTRPTVVGTVLAAGDWKVSYLQPGVSTWRDATIVSAPDHELRYAVLPPNVRVQSIRRKRPVKCIWYCCWRLRKMWSCKEVRHGQEESESRSAT